MNIFFSSDFHYGHKNIVLGCSSWEDKEQCRKFDTLEEHDEILIQNINKTVSWDSILYFLGDWSFGGIDNVWKFRDRLNVQTINFIGGNHDHHIRNNRIVKTDAGYKNLQYLFSSYSEILEKKIGTGGNNFVLCHYPLRSWHKANRGSIMLHGHEHGNLPDYGEDGVFYRTMDVGVDTHPEFRPYSLEEVLSIMKNRVNFRHHA